MFDLEEGPDGHWYVVANSHVPDVKRMARWWKVTYYSFKTHGDALKLDELFRTPVGVVANSLFSSVRARISMERLGQVELADQLEKLEDNYLDGLSKEFQRHAKE